MNAKGDKNAICIKSYEIENIHFDKGYIEEVQKGERFFPNDYWRVATDKEVQSGFSELKNEQNAYQLASPFCLILKFCKL
jgi:hypothetical protein